jgi:anthranilate phosphoribosyltransferase
VLEALGARIDLTPAGVARCIEQAGFGFMFAPAHHQATRYVVPVRHELAVRTIFNFLGPLTNPAGARRQLIGVSDATFIETIAGALARLGVDRALVVCSEDGLDELSVASATKVIEVNGEEISHYTLAPADVGIEQFAPEVVEQDCAGGTPEQNAAVTRAILGLPAEPAESMHGATPASIELALLNAGAAIYVGGAVDSVAQGVEAARSALADGAAARALEGFVHASNANAPAEAAR